MTTTMSEVDTAGVLAAVQRIAPIIEKYRDEGEAQRRLPDAVVAAMRDAGLLRLWTPKEYGGSGQGNLGSAHAAPTGTHGRYHTLSLTLPPLAVIFLRSVEATPAWASGSAST